MYTVTRESSTMEYYARSGPRMWLVANSCNGSYSNSNKHCSPSTRWPGSYALSSQFQGESWLEAAGAGQRVSWCSTAINGRISLCKYSWRACDKPPAGRVAGIPAAFTSSAVTFKIGIATASLSPLCALPNCERRSVYRLHSQQKQLCAGGPHKLHKHPFAASWSGCVVDNDAKCCGK